MVVLGITAEDGTGFQMQCAACHEMIPGTISFVDALKAGQANILKGGVYCPPCRDVACGHCGAITHDTQKEALITGMRTNKSYRMKICKICELSVMDNILVSRSQPTLV